MKPWLHEQWCIPPEENAQFVYYMEDVLEVYLRPHDPQRPLVCMDEASKQPIGEPRVPLPAEPGQPVRYDYEYERFGSCTLFMVCAPLEGWRKVRGTDRRTRQDWAYAVRELVDAHFPKAEVSTLVMDSLNTHDPASRYETFEPAKARRILEHLDIHHTPKHDTPKHGSWLNMAETEIGVLSRPCLDRRIDDKAILTSEVSAWERDRNEKQTGIDWRFITADARIKLKRLYPTIQT